MQKQVTINSGRSLRQAIDAIIKEQVKSQLYQNAVDEKEKQQNFLGEEDDLLDDSEEKSDSGADKKPSKTTDDETEKLKKGEVTSEDIIDKLNTIRGGKSFKDEDIANKLDEYVESLKKPEKTALLAFLKGLAQIVTGEIPAEDVTDPSDPEPAVKMQKGAEKQSKSIKPNVIKAPPKEEKKKKPAAEDTSGPVPITAKKK